MRRSCVSALGHWLGESFGGNLRLAPDLDEVPALSIEREALWARINAATFLTDDEKRVATGYEPLPAHSLTTLLAKYDPNQPRVPAGNSDGGQWTAEGRGGSGNDSRVLSDENPDNEWDPNAQHANLRRGSLVHRLPNGQFVIVPPAQAARLQAAQNQADTLVREVRDRDPNWIPQPGFRQTIEGEILHYQAVAQQARNRLEEIRLGIGGNYGPPLNAPYSPTTSYGPTQGFNGPALLDLYRNVYREPDLLGRDNFDNNTVAVSSFKGSTVYGVNSEASTYHSEDLRHAIAIRGQLLATYPDKLNIRNIGQWPNNSLFHAESTILLRAARANGGSLEGMTIDVHLDRTVCPSCLAVLPLLTRELGSPTIIYHSTKSDQPLIIRNGAWVK